MTISAREDQLEELRAVYAAQLSSVVQVLGSGSPPDAQAICSSYHSAGVSYFNAFERTLDEYSLPKFEITQDIINRKGEDALNFVETIIRHWVVLRKYCVKFNLIAPEPSVTAYASLQRVIKRFFPDLTGKIKKKFGDNNLPVYGFEHAAKHSGWKMKKNLAIQIIVGAVCLIIGGILAFVFNHPTGIQYMFMRGLFALGFAGVAVGILVGTVKVNWSVSKSLAITATGGIAIFGILYFLNPPSPPNPAPVPPTQATTKP